MLILKLLSNIHPLQNYEGSKTSEIIIITIIKINSR